MVSCPATLITRSSAKVFRMPVLVPSVALTSHQDVSPQFDFRYEPVPARGNCYQAVARETDSPLGSRVTRVARPAVPISTIVIAMKISPSVMAAPVTWW